MLTRIALVRDIAIGQFSFLGKYLYISLAIDLHAHTSVCLCRCGVSIFFRGGVQSYEVRHQGALSVLYTFGLSFYKFARDTLLAKQRFAFVLCLT